MVISGNDLPTHALLFVFIPVETPRAGVRQRRELTTDSGAYAYLAISSSNAGGLPSWVCRWRMVWWTVR